MVEMPAGSLGSLAMATVGGTGFTETVVLATKVPSPFVTLAAIVYGFVPELLGAPVQNDDGIGGEHVYMPRFNHRDGRKRD